MRVRRRAGEVGKWNVGVMRNSLLHHSATVTTALFSMSHAQYLLRFDDICPTMNWRVWAEIESVLIQRRLKPILAVVPDNRDPGLQVDTPVADFWERARAWQEW